jgi:brefeldin A-inhibited guanine nucleotide-exchange protein
LLPFLCSGVVQTICTPFQGPHTDDSIQLQIIKVSFQAISELFPFFHFQAILALILSSTCKIHDSSLLLAVRTCFNIYLASRSPINQSTAKGILTQTINCVFANMERVLTDGSSREMTLDWESAVSLLVDLTDVN